MKAECTVTTPVREGGRISGKGIVTGGRSGRRASQPLACSLAVFEPSLHFVDFVHALDDDAAGRGGDFALRAGTLPCGRSGRSAGPMGLWRGTAHRIRNPSRRRPSPTPPRRQAPCPGAKP